MNKTNFYFICADGEPIAPHDSRMDMVHDGTTATAIKVFLQTIDPSKEYTLAPCVFVENDDTHNIPYNANTR